MKSGWMLVLAMLAASCRGDDLPRGAESSAGAAATEEREGAGETPPADPRSPEAAAAVLRDYYAAIASHDYGRAYGLWADDGGASGQTLEAFRDGLAETSQIGAAIGAPGRIEGAAGSRYIEVPVMIRAAQGGQCVGGTYTLRRSEVEGATREQQGWRIYGAALSQRPEAECGAVRPGAGTTRIVGAALEAEDSVRQVVERMGRQLASVSLQAPSQDLRESIRDRYAPLVTSALLETWLANPAAAPGREVSSPWPDRIDVTRVEQVAADRYQVTGALVFATSTGGVRAGDGEGVTAEVTRTRDGWRISGWR